MIRALVVDDEPPARAQVREFLADTPDVCIVGESGDGADALARIRLLDPDLVFMDIRMPQMSGLEVLQSEPKLPYTIFTTAYADHAVEAFAVDALDYLVKPLERGRFRAAVERARRYLERDAALLQRVDPATLQTFLASMGAFGSRRDRVPIRTGRTTQFIDADAIEYIEADGDYATIHRSDGGLLRTREGIAALEARLPPTRFTRVHRSLIVNLDHIREVRSNKRGGLRLVMLSGRRLTSGGKYESAIFSLIRT